MWTLTLRTCGVVAAASLIVWCLVKTGILALPARTELRDARALADYHDHPGVFVSAPSADDVIVATRGGGVQQYRADSGWFGVWRGWDDRSARGALPDLNITQGLDTGHRFLFRGDRGSLTSVGHQLRDWQLPFGGGGFRAHLDLNRDVSTLQVSPDGSFFAVGTLRYGVGVYDIESRQWVPVPQDQTLHGKVNALLIWGRQLLVATEGGLIGYTWYRQEQKLQIAATHEYDLPDSLRTAPVRSIQSHTTLDRPTTLHVAVGRGAYLERAAASGRWKLVTPEASPELKNVNGHRVIDSAVHTEAGIYFGIRKVGPVLYDARARALTPQAQGLPEAVKHQRVSLLHADPAAEDASVWLVADADRGLYRLDEEEWRRVGSGIVHFDFGRTISAALKTGGEVEVLGALEPDDLDDQAFSTAEQHALQLFSPAEHSASVGGAAANSRQLLVAHGSSISRYQTQSRSWKRFDAGRGAIAALSSNEGWTAIAYASGQAGTFEDDEFRAYSPIFGNSDLPTEVADVTGVATFGGEFWLVRAGHPYSYSAQHAAIRKRRNGLPADAVISQLRTTTTRLYAIREGSDRRKVFYTERSEDGGAKAWQGIELPVEAEKVLDSEVAGEHLFLLSDKGAVFVDRGGEPQRAFMTGRVQPGWRKLLDAGGGLIAGLTSLGDVWLYDAARSSWRQQAAGINDIVRHPAQTQGALALSSDTGVQRITFSDTGTETSSEALLSNVAVRSFDIEAGAVWALGSEERQVKGLWRIDSDGDVERVWQASLEDAPSGAAWKEAKWVSFEEEELRWVGESGAAWRYELNERRWHKIDIPSRVSGLQVAPDGSFWWLDSGRLHAGDIFEQRFVEFAKFSFDADGPRYTYYAVLAVALVCGIVGGGCGACLLAWVVIGALWLVASGVTYAADWLWGMVWRATLRFWPRAFGRRRTLKFDLPDSELLMDRWPAGLACFAGALLAAGGLLLAYWLISGPIDRWRVEREQYEGLPKQDICAFGLTPDSLVVHTRRGSYRLKRDAFSLTPVSFEANANGCAQQRPDDRLLVGKSRDNSGAWKLTRSTAGVELGRRDALNNWRTVDVLDGGLSLDVIEEFVVTGDHVLARTRAGFAQFQVQDGALRLSRWLPPPSGANPRLRKIEGRPVLCSDAGRMGYEPSQPSVWAPAADQPWTAQAYGKRWSNGCHQDTFDEAIFDAAAGKFVEDIGQEFQADAEGTLWVRTPKRWRQMRVRNGSVALTTGGEPKPYVQRSRIGVNSFWSASRETPTQGPDKITFTFLPTRTSSADPFQKHGRFPEERALSLYAGSETVWVGTAAGVRSLTHPKLLDLPGRAVTRLYASSEYLLAQTHDGAFRRARSPRAKWESTAADALPEEWHVELKVGDGMRARASQRYGEGRVKGELVAFDAEKHRFGHDVIEDIVVDDTRLIALTPDGVQRLTIHEGKVTEQRADLTTHGIVALRRALHGAPCVIASDERAWVLKKGGWSAIDATTVEASQRTHPCGTEMRKLSSLLSLDRSYEESGDHWNLAAGSHRLELRDGKFDVDYIHGIVEKAPGVQLVSSAGVIMDSPTGLVPLRGKETRVVWQGEALVTREDGADYGYERTTERWSPIQTDAMNHPLMVFKGAAWKTSTSSTPGEFVHWERETRPGAESSRGAVLNESGQFAFDAVHSLALLGGDVWIATEATLLRTNPDLLVERHRDLPETLGGRVKCNNALRTVATNELRLLRRCGNTEIDFVVSGTRMDLSPAPLNGAQDAGPALRWPTPEGDFMAQAHDSKLVIRRPDDKLIEHDMVHPVVSMARSGETLWVLTTNGVYKVDWRQL